MAIPPKQSQVRVKKNSSALIVAPNNGDSSRLTTYLESVGVALCAIFYFRSIIFAGFGIQVCMVPMWFLSPVVMNRLK